MSTYSISENRSILANQTTVPAGNLNELEKKVDKLVSRGNVFAHVGTSGLLLGSSFAFAAYKTAPILPLSITFGILSLIFYIGGIVALYLGKRTQDQIEQVQAQIKQLPREDNAVHDELEGIPSPTGESSYIDWGLSFGCSIWNFIDWSTNPPQLILANAGAYLSSLFSQMQGAGMKTIDIAFGQLDNIDFYNSGDFDGSGIDITTDVVTQLEAQLIKGNVVVPGYPTFLKYFIQQAHASNMKVSLSFGGADGQDKNFKVLQQPGETYVGEATNLVAFLNNYGVDVIDFDIEDPTALSSQQPDDKGGTIVSFFQTLHTQLSAAGKKMTLTSMLGIGQWPQGALKSLFYDQNNQPIFTTLFDGLNMMAYGGDNQYWLDPSNSGWGIEQWLNIIGPQNAGLMNIGFDDAVAYESSSANAGSYQYSIAPGSTRGQAAAQIYIQLQQQMINDGFTTPLGQPFFWPDQSVQPNGESRYGTNGNKSNFVSPCMQDFYNTLSSQEIMEGLIPAFG